MMVNAGTGSNEDLSNVLGGIATWERGAAIPATMGNILSSIDKGFPVMDGPTSTVALRRAVQTVASTKLVARSLKGRKGVAVLPLAVDDHKITVDGESVAFHVGPRGVYSVPAGHYLVTAVNDAYDAAYAEIASSDIAGALSAFIRTKGGVAMSSAGGMYYLRPDVVSVWRKAADALRPFGWRVYAVPFLRDPENVSMVVDYVVRGIAAEIKAIDDELHGDNAGKLRDSTVTRRHAQLRDLRDRATAYEKLLGVSLETLRSAASAAATESGAAAILEGLL